MLITLPFYTKSNVTGLKYHYQQHIFITLRYYNKCKINM